MEYIRDIRRALFVEMFEFMELGENKRLEDPLAGGVFFKV